MNTGSNAYPYTRMSRTGSAFAASVLAHALLLALLGRQLLLDPAQPAPPPSPISVRFAAAPQAPAAEPEVPSEPALPAAESAPEPPPPPSPAKPRKRPVAKPRPPAPEVLATPQPQAVQEPVQQPPDPAPQAPAEPPRESSAPDPAQFADMAAYVRAMKDRRLQAGDPGRLNEEAMALARPPSEDEVRLANLARPQAGTSGVFQILSMDRRRASFAFRGWQNQLSYSRREFYEVQVGTDGDLPRAVVRKMIEIIRRYYSGDFNWQSPRFGTVIVLSARPQDNAGLEDFLMQEFFANPGIATP